MPGVFLWSSPWGRQKSAPNVRRTVPTWRTDKLIFRGHTTTAFAFFEISVEKGSGINLSRLGSRRQFLGCKFAAFSNAAEVRQMLSSGPAGFLGGGLASQQKQQEDFAGRRVGPI